ncbi:MAG: hypothetical protein JWO36_223 [Myxococcales bacterium]|nr:hypothetical protein [Myxococcales bacterium]
MVNRVLLGCALVWMTACGFNERKFTDRQCNSDQDCGRPDETCVLNTCTEKACTVASDCGPANEFSCTSGLCVVRGCTSSADCSLGYACVTGFCQAAFNVTSATSVSNTSITLTFDAPPNAAQATAISNYAISGLTVNGTPSLSGNTVTLTTTAQANTSYTVTVSGITRASDGASLTIAVATFTGRAGFNVASAASVTSASITVTFDAPPNSAQAMTLGNYTIGGLTLTGMPMLIGNTVTLVTSPQASSTYTITVANVTRAGDGEALTTGSAAFHGRTPFDVASASSASSGSIMVTFDAPPNAAQATTLGNYTVPGLTLSGAPILSGSTVTLNTSPQSATTYTITVANVTRASDGEALTIATSNVTGHTRFNVVSAASASSGSITVTFDSPPDPTLAGVLANYSVPGLTLGGTPSLSGNIVTLATSPQAVSTYTVTVSNITRAGDAEPLTNRTASFTGRPPFDVASAASASSGSITVTFDAPPDPATATNLGNYAISGLTLGGTPTLSGSKVTLLTSPQSATTYTVTVSSVTRASDAEPLTVASATFTGRNQFNVASAASATSASILVSFDAPPNAAQATNLANYSVPGLLLSGAPSLSGSTVTLTTSAQGATTYTVSVSGVTRASDAEPLTIAAANFTGRIPFNVASAASASSGSITLTFDATPNAAAASTLANYSIAGLTLGGAPSLSGNTVTLATSPQSATSYTVSVSGVTRASDGEPLTITSATFTGRTRFNVASAASVSSSSITVTFDAPPTASQAMMLGNYAIPGLTLSGTPVVSGNTVTVSTSPQSTTTFTVGVSNVTRASDGEALTIQSATFTGRAPFNVTSSASTSSRSITVTFDAPPNAAQATMLSNYSIFGLSLTGAPLLSGNTVTLTTSAQAATTYGVIVSGVTRASDAEPLTVASAGFTGRAPFNVVSAASASGSSITVTFDAPPDPLEATNILNYSVPGLSLSGTPVLSGNTVTITTSVQSVTSYTVTVSVVGRASDDEPLTIDNASFTGRTGFNVASAASLSKTSITVTFDAPPTASEATTLSNYTVSGLTLTGTPALAGSTVTITTSAQSASTYTVNVSGVTRASDSTPLTIASASFTHTNFNVASAAAVTSHSITVTYDAPPNAAQATTRANYSVPGLTLSGTPTLAGSTVTITTSAQTATSYTVTVTGVTRASDGEPLTTAAVNFTGRAPFNVASATSSSSTSIAVTFDAPPTASQATTLASYAVPGLTLSGTPVLSGNVVTVTTSAQQSQTYTVTVSGVTRASDAEPLTTAAASFTGTAVKRPTVTNVAVQSTSPSNGTAFYNTGAATVRITGTDFVGVTCPSGVTLDDLDGAGNTVATPPTSCTVDSSTQITATFPAGIRTNGAFGWNVRVTNGIGANTTSAVRLVPLAGLLISEIETGTTLGGTREFVELYNPTTTSIDVTAIGLAVHIRAGNGADSNKTLTFINHIVPSHGFLLISSAESVAANAWYAHRDVTYSALTNDLVSNGGVYISLSASSNIKVIDKVGFGSQGSSGVEGTSITNIPADSSAQRKPAGGAGAATDTDNNAADFNAASTTITPLGTVDPPQP